MAKINKGFAMSCAVLGVLAFIFGLGVSICSWILSGKVSNLNFSTRDSYYQSTTSINFKSYWWGGLFYLLPGIMGILAGCTRNVTAMVFYMIFNILCLISSVLVSILVAVAMVAWSVIEVISQQGQCVTSTGAFMAKGCVCSDNDGNVYTLRNITCSDVASVQTILAAIVVLASISSLLAFVASYISCCALCNQTPDTTTVILPHHGAASYQPPQAIVVNNSSSQQQQFSQGYAQPGYPQPGYPQPGYPGQQQYAPPPYSVPSHDKANLTKNEVI